MFAELNNMCQLPGDGHLPGKCVLIDGCYGADSAFVVHHFVSVYLKSGFQLCFLALSQTFNHYSTIATKLGVSMVKAKENGNLVFIEGLKHLGEEILKGEEESQSPTISDWVHFDREDYSGLKNLYQHCKACIGDLHKGHPDKPILLVIDDLSIFSLLGFASLEIIYFLSYLRSLMSACNGCMLAQAQCDAQRDDADADVVLQHITHQCDCVIKVEALSSGYCKDVHGQITVYNRWPGSDASSRTMQYKIQDKSVTFFAPGMSAAVL